MVIELNRESIEIISLSHSMSRATICRFRLNVVHDDGADVGQPADLSDNDAKFSMGDTELLTTRQEVRYTADDGKILFVGKILPASRNINTGSEGVEYTAADFIEFLGNNPCDEVNKYYNRNRNDSIVVEYPFDQSVEEIINTEFARLLGVPTTEEHIIREIDWSNAQDIKDFIVRDFNTEGKTWLQLLDDMRNEIPMLGYWLDPRECNRTDDIRGYTLRMFNLSPHESGDDAIDDDERVRIVTPMRDGMASVNRENVEQFSFNEDISQSYDKLTIKAWGHLYERYEQLELGWDDAVNRAGKFAIADGYPNIGSAKTVYPLRYNNDERRWERYSDAVGSNGSFLANAGDVWTPERDTLDARRAFRRYKIPNKPSGDIRRAINKKFTLETLPSGDTQIIEISPATKIDALSHLWYIGSISFTIGGVAYNGSYQNGIKIINFTGGIENDWGDVKPNLTYYPDYPDGPDGPGSDLTPRFEINEVQAIEENMILLSEPFIRETKYLFLGNIDGSGWNNMMNQPISVFWGAGYDVWAQYTAWDELEAVRENSALGYDKHMVLYEPRFFKYTKLDGTVIRDDTVILNDFAEILFQLIVKPRYTGSVTLDVTEMDDGAQVFNNRINERDIFMGSPIQIENWKPGDDYTVFMPNVLIQSLELANYDSQKRVSIGFDNPQTFIPLEKTQEFRSFFEGSFDNGSGGTNSNGGCGCGPGDPPNPGGGGGGGGGGGTTEPPVSTGTGTPPTTTPPTSSSGTTGTNSTSDTTFSETTSDPSTTTESTTDIGSSITGTVTLSTFSSTLVVPSSITTMGATGVQASKQAEIGDITPTTTTTPIPAQQYTGTPLDLD